MKRNIGFVSTRLAGTDGVSLEVDKWARVLEKLGHKCFYMAGELDTPPEKSLLLEEAHFDHPEIREITEECFNVQHRKRSITDKVHQIKDKLKDEIYRFVEKYRIDILLPENALCIPLNIPLGIALTEFIAETKIPTIAHHHDFFWERPRFLVNAVGDYLCMAFPPSFGSIKHVVINSAQDNQLSYRTGISATIIPNVMDFESPPPPPDDYASDVRKNLSISDNEHFILQPTRIVQRKGIEHSIELVSRLKMPAKFVISHSAGDEGQGYKQRLENYSKMLNVNTLFASDVISDHRGKTEDGRKIYKIEDIYPHADLVTYPSDYEGFGNAFLETIYFRKPIVVNIYSVYHIDIKPKGFQAIELEGYVTPEAVEQAREILKNPSVAKKMTDNNYQLGREHYSYSTLEIKLSALLESF